ncbi:uncharacterized protein LOC144209003 [Stigmatopora nigra]
MKWRLGTHLCVFVFLRLIETSKEHCIEYLSNDQWKKETQLSIISLVIPENITDVAECTLESYCLEGKMCNVLKDCFSKKLLPKSTSKKCKSSQKMTVHSHLLMCFIAVVVNSTNSENGCEYDSICPLYEKMLDAATRKQTTIGPTTTGPTTTGQTTTGPTTTGPTTTGPTTIMTSTVWPSQTELPMTSQVSLSTVLESKEQHLQNLACQSKDDFILKVLLAISSTLAIVLPFAVYFYMRCQRMQSMSCQCCNPSGKSDLPVELRSNLNPLMITYKLEQM